MRNWPADLLTQLQSEEYRFFHLVEFQFSTPLRYTSCDVPLVIGGDEFDPRPLDIPEISYSIGSSVDKITIDMDMADRDAALLQEFVGGTPGDTVVVVYLQVLDSNMVAIANAVIFHGSIDSYDYVDSSLTITVASFHSLWNKRTMERSSPSCRRNFRRPDCGYAGAETECDRSYNRCTELNNTDRFNGFRFLPDLEDKDIWWGQEPKHET
jgi:hypothetical protein